MIILQDLPPRWARFCLEIRSFMESLARESITEKRLLVAFSGGADSLALLRVLCFLQPGSDFKVFAAHLNHMLRTESHREQQYARQVCSSLNIPFFSENIDVFSSASATNAGIEEAARTVRYDFLGRTARELKADYVLTGHQLNDLAEDVLMRLGRGTGWPGLSGMSGIDHERKLIRPLILTSRKKILAFLEAVHEIFVVDASNEDRSFLRNRMRHEAVPLLEELTPGFLRSVANLWQMGRIDEEHWKSVLQLIPRKVVEDGVHVSSQALMNLSRATRLRLYKNILDGLGPGQALFQNLVRLDALWQRGAGNKQVQFPGDKFGLVVNKGVTLGLKQNRQAGALANYNPG